MPVDHIRYDILAQDALRGVVRNVLADAANKGLPGEHHFFITFDTARRGRAAVAAAAAQYPEEMTIVLQHQFWDLKVTDDAFEVGLSFGGVPERLLVPFDAIKASSIRRCSSACSSRSRRTRTTTPTRPRTPRPSGAAAGTPRPPPRRAAGRGTSVCRRSPPAAAASREPTSAEVVRLDRFRKK